MRFCDNPRNCSQQRQRQDGVFELELVGSASDCHALALYFFWYNWVRIHKTLKVTPAMAAGLTDKLLSMSDLAEMIDAAQPKPGKRGPYKKRAA
jgi:hypothetical protein